MSAAGIAGLVLSAWVQARLQAPYTPVLSDWIWHVVLPVVAHAALAAARSCPRADDHAPQTRR